MTEDYEEFVDAEIRELTEPGPEPFCMNERLPEQGQVEARQGD